MIFFIFNKVKEIKGIKIKVKTDRLKDRQIDRLNEKIDRKINRQID